MSGRADNRRGNQAHSYHADPTRPNTPPISRAYNRETHRPEPRPTELPAYRAKRCEAFQLVGWEAVSAKSGRRRTVGNFGPRAFAQNLPNRLLIRRER